jgi:hypothetical protein
VSHDAKRQLTGRKTAAALQRIADLNEAAGAADATRELDGSVYALGLK